jgi:hypothetical protein
LCITPSSSVATDPSALLALLPKKLEKRPALAIPGVLVKANIKAKKKQAFVVKDLFDKDILAKGLFEEYGPSSAFVVWFFIK